MRRSKQRHGRIYPLSLPTLRHTSARGRASLFTAHARTRPPRCKSGGVRNLEARRLQSQARKADSSAKPKRSVVHRLPRVRSSQLPRSPALPVVRKASQVVVVCFCSRALRLRGISDSKLRGPTDFRRRPLARCNLQPCKPCAGTPSFLLPVVPPRSQLRCALYVTLGRPAVPRQRHLNPPFSLQGRVEFSSFTLASTPPPARSATKAIAAAVSLPHAHSAPAIWRPVPHYFQGHTPRYIARYSLHSAPCASHIKLAPAFPLLCKLHLSPTSLREVVLGSHQHCACSRPR